MVASHSVTILIEKLRATDDVESNRAAHDLWQRYVSNLVWLARRYLSERVRRREDEEDVLQKVYDSFCRGHRAGRYELGDREDLWRLLVSIVQNKAANTAAHHHRARRDQRRERSGDGDDDAPGLLEAAAGTEPTPDEAVALMDELRHVLARLEPQLQQLVLWKLEGYTNEEIAGRMNCVVRSVERKLARARLALAPRAAEAEGEAEGRAGRR